MGRLFMEHKMRKTFSLDGHWWFKTDPKGVGEEEKWFSEYPEGLQNAIVPSCWNNETGLLHYEGTAWYFKEFNTDAENILLSFGAVTGFSKVFLDGKYLGEHYGGFSAFEFAVRDITAGTHRLSVMVDASSSEETIPLKGVDWFHYGGIIRSVTVLELGEVLIRDLKIEYDLDDALENAVINCSLTLENLTSTPKSRNVKILIDGVEMHDKTYPAGERVEILGINLKNIKLWDVFKPNLYIVTVETEDDDITDRIGFRKIEVRGKKIYLNNKRIFIKGINRHEEHPEWGFAFPEKLMKRDIDIIKDMGCNAIRGSHYPNSKTFLDYMDEEGILFWSEIPMWGYPEEALQNPVIAERGLAMHREMVEQYRHHPSIIIWGLHNEIDTTCQRGYEITKLFSDEVRRLDSTRLITFATDRVLDDICLGMADFVSVNSYVGWYRGEIEDWADFLVGVKEKLKNEGLENVPIVMSEFGAASIYGDNSFDDVIWSAAYHERLIRHTLKLFRGDPDISGTYIWQFCDIRTEPTHSLNRARSFNNKGIVNEYRKPKMVYKAVKSIQNDD